MDRWQLHEKFPCRVYSRSYFFLRTKQQRSPTIDQLEHYLVCGLTFLKQNKCVYIRLASGYIFLQISSIQIQEYLFCGQSFYQIGLPIHLKMPSDKVKNPAVVSFQRLPLYLLLHWEFFLNKYNNLVYHTLLKQKVLVQTIPQFCFSFLTKFKYESNSVSIKIKCTVFTPENEYKVF